MTGLYQYHPMPHQLALACPQCAGQADFEFLVAVSIERKVDVPWFQAHPLLEYWRPQDSCGHYRHYALYYPGLHGDPLQSLGPLPEGYRAEQWRQPRHGYRQHSLDHGSVSCPHCDYQARHALNWPTEAYYGVPYRGQLLWAYHRESALALHDYLLSTRRDPGGYPWQHFLRHIPSPFKSRKAREPLTRLLKRLLNHA